MTISTLVTAIVLSMSVVSSGVYADVWSGGISVDNVWSENVQDLYVAGSGDNPWALPQENRAKTQGPAYQVNPHYVTPEDLKPDSLDETDRRSLKRGPSSTNAPESTYRGRQQVSPYGMNYLPGYVAPGYGGYYGGFSGMYGGAPGFGGDPLLYPYGGGMDLGDPYNLMMQPYSTDSEGDRD